MPALRLQAERVCLEHIPLNKGYLLYERCLPADQAGKALWKLCRCAEVKRSDWPALRMEEENWKGNTSFHREQGKSLSFCKLNKEADMEGYHEIAVADWGFFFLILVYPKCSYTFVMEQEEPYESRGSRRDPWERGGEIPLRDPTMANKNWNQLCKTIWKMFHN